MTFFSLFSSCVLTKGINKSCLIDLERSLYCTIPNELYELLENKFNISLTNIKNKYSDEDFEVINRYLLFLKKELFIYFHKTEKKIVNDIAFENYSTPYHIEDLIIDLKQPFVFLNKIENKLPKNIETIQLRFFYQVSTLELKKIVEKLRLNGYTNLEIFFNHTPGVGDSVYKSIYESYPIVSKLFIMNYGANKHILNNLIIGFKKPLISEKQCGKISEKNFYPNLRTYLSSKKCNSCLASKISIDSDGEIKNCPSMQKSYGNILKSNIELDTIFSSKEFQKLWKITKDDIEICKDCEYRYICTDCRAYTESPKNTFSKPLKCGYNPYNSKWENWIEDPKKQKAIKFYGLHEIND